MSIFKELAWPANCRMDLLREVLVEEILEKLINHFMDKSEEERMVRFPKQQTIKKLLSYHYGKKVFFGEMGWSEVLKEMKGQTKTLKDLGLSKKEMVRLFDQRRKEILREKDER